MSSNHRPRPIILVTGANAGYSSSCPVPHPVIPSQSIPPSVLQVSNHSRPPFAAPHGCTLILACRNAIKAHKARKALLSLVKRLSLLSDNVDTPTTADELEKMGLGPAVGAKETVLRKEPEEVLAASGSASSGSGEDETLPTNGHPARGSSSASSLRQRKVESTSKNGKVTTDSFERSEAKARGRYRRRFCRGTKIEFVPLDLASMASIFTCAKQVSERYPYLTHVILNAGGGAFAGIDWLAATWSVLTEFHNSMTVPRFKIQRVGDVSQDGLGWVWQTNIGSSWVLAHALLPHLRRSPYSTPSRIIFTSSIEALYQHYDPSDFQCIATDCSYESTKFQCDLAALAFQEELRQLKDSEAKTGPRTVSNGEKKYWTQPEVYLTHPGVVATSIMAEWLNIITSFGMLLCFYVARWTGSPHHLITPYKGSISHTFTSLAPSTSLTPYVKYASQCDFWGREYVGEARIDRWNDQDEAGAAKIWEERGGSINGTPSALDRQRLAQTPASLNKSASPSVLPLVKPWLTTSTSILQKVRRLSDAGTLPPSASASPRGGKEAGFFKEELQAGGAGVDGGESWEGQAGERGSAVVDEGKEVDDGL